ncbi:hypothetical protein OG824_05185 [Streptomyces prunicolor]|uniref:hypothetical protein n=1 Tax=Streptomyces prunicolor TaxID=67348 RepID=UPI00225795C7|nr:hypothetical protein [Streptomyces prunicolor]MCX5234625.1 hypothetical protein [Streptomyces prunicolor]
MEDETEVIELEEIPRDQTRETRRTKKIEARANLLYLYLKLFDRQPKQLTQIEMSEALALGSDGRLLRQAVGELESRGWLEVDRGTKTHTYKVL